MRKLRPYIRLYKPSTGHTETYDEAAAGLRLLLAWTRAWGRVHGQRERMTRSYGPDYTGKRKQFAVPPLVSPCDCDQPVQCVTDGHGGILQECVRCGAANTVRQRHGLAIVPERPRS